MRIMTLAILTAAMAVSTPGLAKNKQIAENQVDATASQSGAAKKICRRPIETGTRLTPRLCMTKEEWKQVEDMKYRQ